MVNLSSADAFSFTEMLRSAKEVKDRDYKKIYIQANEIDSPMPRKLRRTEPPEASNSCRDYASASTACLQPKQLSFSPRNVGPSTSKQSPLDSQQKDIQDNLQVLKVQIASAKEELAKLNDKQKQYRSLSEIHARVCNICHHGGHTKTTCSNAPCTDISLCKICEKHPEEKQNITQLQREIKALENKYTDEETNLKSFAAARERSKSSFFAVMRPRLKAQDILKYGSGNRTILDRDLLILQRALKKIPDWSESEDWRLPQLIEQYKNSSVNIYMPDKV